MSRLLKIPIEDVRRRRDVRPLNEETVAALEESIAAVGLINPIHVRQSGDVYEIIAGSHRFAACDLLGHREIMALVVEVDDLHAELAMIDENLCRAELSPADRAKQTARRKSIYEELHPETKREATLKRGDEAPSRQVGETGVDRFTADTAATSGRSERAVQRDAERGEKVIDEVVDMIRGTPLDTGVYLDRLKRLTPNEQVAATKRDLAHIRGQEREGSRRGGIASRYTGTSPQPPADADAFARFLKLADEMEALPVRSLVAGSGRQRAVLGQRASGLADFMSTIMEGLDQ
jgi:hypothetical protein